MVVKSPGHETDYAQTVSAVFLSPHLAHGIKFKGLW